MRCRRTAGIGLLTGLMLIGACGEEIPEQQVSGGKPPEKPACELVRQSDLQQIFVNPLTTDSASGSSNRQCTWNDAATDKPFVKYELHSYSDDLQARVNLLEQELGESVNPRFVQGIGDAAVWTDIGLFVNRSGRTLQVKPLQDDENRAPYQELARLLLTRLEGS
ncbi:MAG: hypothetical protein WD795_07180 [Woeseia sp.]